MLPYPFNEIIVPLVFEPFELADYEDVVGTLSVLLHEELEFFGAEYDKVSLGL